MTTTAEPQQVPKLRLARSVRLTLSSWADLQRKPHPEPRRSKYAARLGGLIALLSLCGYLTWRVTTTLPHSGLNRVAGIALFVTEAIPLFSLLCRLLTMWTLRTAVPPRSGPDETYGPAVIFIPTLNEPLEILAPTVAAACALEPVHETWVLDDGDRPWVADMCSAYGARYVTRPEHGHAKAGNMNHALRLLTIEESPAEFIALLDCDHVPLPGFLYETLGWFDHKDLAIVQAPQAYYNADSFESTSVSNEQDFFYHVLMPSRVGKRADPFWAGSTSLLRRIALEEIGGVTIDTVTEDFHTTLRLLRRGWRTTYHHQVLGVGVAPETPDKYMRQRRRWALGAMQIFVREKLWLPKRWLSLRNWFEYNSSIFWWFEGLFTLAGMVVPALMMVGGIRASRANVLTYALLLGTATLLRAWGNNRLYRGYMRWAQAIELRMYRIPIGVSCLWWLLTRRQLSFDTTVKGGGSARESSRVPALLTGIATVIACLIVYGTVTLLVHVPWHTSRLATMTAGVWLLYGEATLLMAIGRARSEIYTSSRRASYRFDARATIEVDGQAAELTNISAGGALVQFAGEVPEDESALLTLPGCDPVLVSRTTARGSQVSYALAGDDYAGARTLAQWIFHTPTHYDSAMPAGIPAAAAVREHAEIGLAIAKGEAAVHDPHKPRRRDIQGMRALAIGLVIAAHAGIPGLAGGFIGVDVFFVISGYLIMSLMLRELRVTGRISIVSFYARRALRILPAAAVVSAAILLVTGITSSVVDLRQTATDALWSSVFLENFHLINVATNYFADQSASPFQHFWSLSVEEQFYIVWPAAGLLLLRATPRRVLRRAMLVGIALGVLCAIAETQTDASSAYFSVAVRAYELLIGVALAYFVARSPRLPAVFEWVAGVLGLALIVGGSIILRQTDFPSWKALIPTLGAALLIAAGLRNERGINWLLGQQPFRWLGNISYSLYLWHWPFLIIGGTLLTHRLPHWDRIAILIGLSVLAAQLSYWLIERPVLKLGAGGLGPQLRWAGIPRAFIVWPVALGTVVACFAIATDIAKHRAEVAGQQATRWYAAGNHPCSTALPKGATAVALIQSELECAQTLDKAGAPVPATVDPTAIPAQYDNGYDAVGCPFEAKYPGPACVDPRRPTATVVMIGDSHMQHYSPELKEIAKASGWRLYAFFSAGCSAFDTRSLRIEVDNGLGYSCLAYRRSVDSWLTKIHPKLIILGGYTNPVVAVTRPTSWAPASVTHAWRTAISQGLADYESYADHVLLVGDTPLRGVDVPDCLDTPAVRVRECNGTLYTTMWPAIDTELGAIAANDGVGFVNPLPLVCTKIMVCPAVADGIGVYADTSHIAPEWALHVAPAFDELLDPVLHAIGMKSAPLAQGHPHGG